MMKINLYGLLSWYRFNVWVQEYRPLELGTGKQSLAEALGPGLTMTTREKQVILELLEAYKKMPFLWNRQHEQYTNRHMRGEGHRALLQIYTKVDENATVKTLGKKIQNLRTFYLKELDKVLASERAGGEVYVPTLWYFDAMGFLGHRAGETHSGTDTDPFVTVETSLDYETFDEESISSASSAKRVKRQPLEHQQHIKSSEKTNSSQEDDRWATYGKTIAYQLKDLSEHQSVICQKLISDAIFYAKLNKLNENSHIVNPDDSD